jgi:hypothetical protein
MEPRNRCQGINSASLFSLAGRYENPIPPQCLAPIDFLKIPALACQAAGGIDSLKSISGLLKCLQIRAHLMKCVETMIIFHAKRELQLIFTSFEIIPRKGK